MNENSSGWAGMGAYSADNANQASMQGMGNILAGRGTGFAQPSIASQLQAMLGGGGNTYGGAVMASPNGYPMFSSPSAGLSSPSGYANANPVDSTPNVVAPQARAATPAGMPQNPSMPQPPKANPWNIPQSSGEGDPFGYPTGKPTATPQINVL